MLTLRLSPVFKDAFIFHIITIFFFTRPSATMHYHDTSVSNYWFLLFWYDVHWRLIKNDNKQCDESIATHLVLLAFDLKGKER